ncbi:MAG: bifunctional glutamate N-acetyltransferase/amino-acid acetyltransferase ArgJ [Porticoccaceae bacterium]|nr:bifunctional glutamate N-acetyltransferase/amino-acid acetyltransferase ArgJ [Pseudomonadales bacterium]MCP5170768.1 bifunctional glutamate N-acetyltransferase/amino-acid acetyltransferase ArgJ [Pseudomonadales bacterium]MCP5301991.1 bifunctional glutamate N-acetyltransferase/amino-acid acetyltransferase ArgJ [Pseudomonadales bacterium]
MAVGENTFPLMHPVAGFRLGVASAGIKKAGRKDLVVMEITAGASIAAAFTKNAFCAAPVQIAKTNLAENTCCSSLRYLVTNTGNANAGTGEQGHKNALQVCQALADLQAVDRSAVLPFSTGVIGEPLPVEKIITALPSAIQNLTERGWDAAATAILTTDTRPKGASSQLVLAGKTVTITGVSKGSGMIKPNMATMLAYVATDLHISQELLQQWITELVDVSFNRITVDGDTSTNDSAVLVATGCSGVDFAELGGSEQQLYREALQSLFIDLAQQIIKDGEGASKFVSVVVDGGVSVDECLAVAYTIAESPLVKTALFASDPNWGRILAAVGRAGVADLDVNAVQLYLDDVLIADQGGRAASYTEQQGQAVMNRDEITIRVLLNRGQVCETVWTTDFSHDYVTINAEYRT